MLPGYPPYRPGSHGPEHDGSVSPATCPYWPALPVHRDNHDGKGTKEKHTDIAWLSMNPAGFTSIVPFFSTYGQATHATLLVASVMLLYVPAGHLVQGHPHNIGLNNMQNQDTNKPNINTSHTQSHTQTLAQDTHTGTLGGTQTSTALRANTTRARLDQCSTQFAGTARQTTGSTRHASDAVFTTSTWNTLWLHCRWRTSQMDTQSTMWTQEHC